MSTPTIVDELDNLLHTISYLYTNEGKAREVAILAYGKPEIQVTDHDNWDGGTDIYTIWLRIPAPLFGQIVDSKDAIEADLKLRLSAFLHAFPKTWLNSVVLLPTVEADAQWREKAKAWVTGEGVTNQGRVRSDNVAPLTCDGLLFRSQPEINLYRALKATGVSFAPLPVFLRGGDTYRRIEPDFVLFQDGVLLLLEVDGDTIHLETPAEAHARTTMLLHEGAIIERVNAAECSTTQKATETANRLLELLRKHRNNR